MIPNGWKAASWGARAGLGLSRGRRPAAAARAPRPHPPSDVIRSLSQGCAGSGSAWLAAAAAAAAASSSELPRSEGRMRRLAPPVEAVPLDAAPTALRDTVPASGSGPEVEAECPSAASSTAA